MLAEKLPPEFTGSGRQAVILSKALIGQDVRTVGLCSQPKGKSSWDESWGFPIARLHTSSKEQMRSLEFVVKSILWLLKNRDEYDILHVHGYCWAGLTGIIVVKLLGKKALYKITLPGEDDPEALFQSRLGHLKIILLNRFDAFVSISDRVQKCIKGFSQRSPRLFTISNGVDERFHFDEAASKEAREKLIIGYQLTENAQIVSYMGSIEYRKGIDILARAWSRILSDLPHSRLFLVGPFFEATPFCGQLRALLGDHLGKTVFLVGKVSDPELYYQASDVFVFPSRNESFGNALVEAMACGKACVASLIEGLTDSIIKDGYNGIIIKQDDHEALATAVVRVLTSPRLKRQIGRNAAQTATANYKMGTIAGKYRDLYQSLLSEEKGNT